MKSKVNICNINIDNLSMEETLEMIDSVIESRETRYIVTPNVDHIMTLQKDKEFRRIYEEAFLVLPDGMPLVWASKILGCPLKDKISGSDLFPLLCERAQKKNYKLFFLGGKPGVAARSAEILGKRYKGIQIAGVHSPPYGFENDQAENESIISRIKRAKPDILFVGLGAPKQEKWIYRHYKELDIPVNIGIGITFEFIAGTIKRAPLWMQKSGLEWLWRLTSEPGRLWKRYLIDDMRFFGLLLKQKIGQNKTFFKDGEKLSV